MNEDYGNPLSFTPINFASLQMPGTLRMTLPDQERMPLGYKVDDDGKVSFCLYYPRAERVSVHGYLFALKLEKKDGYWVGKMDLGKGFVMIWLVVDGSITVSQYLPFYYSDNRIMNYVDIPDGTESRRIRAVPHGTVAQEYISNSVTGGMERVNVYLPPMYFQEAERRCPVLFLQHGFSENETAWLTQGKINFVLDNLISEGRVVPMLVVMCNGMMVTGDEKGSELHYGEFQRFLGEDVMPHIFGRYRVAEGQENRAMAGLSMGGVQTFRMALLHPELFGAVGLFSGFFSDPLGGYNDHLTPENLAAFRKAGTYLFRAIGDEDPYMHLFEGDDKLLKEADVPSDRRIYRGKHEWNVWRQCFVDFVQLLFS